MDDEIIYSWCFNAVECFDSTPSAAIIILVDNLERLWTLRSQQDSRWPHVACRLMTRRLSGLMGYWAMGIVGLKIAKRESGAS